LYFQVAIMKKIVFFLLISFSLPVFAFAQEVAKADTVAPLPPYLKVPFIPPFDIIQLDSSHFKKENLPKNKKVVVVCFSPTCSHCRGQMETILADLDKFENTEFVWVTGAQMDVLKEFVKEYALEKYPNIHVGKEDKRFLPEFYKITHVPFIALYDKKGRLVQGFDKNLTAQVILDCYK
jgi:cytochrome oxidase Cu insertion factor (SCO1/SenC/PrrC family)